ncbi:MAG: hypothetical protein ACP5O7_13155, partial [Phycisphaerae bacterium]
GRWMEQDPAQYINGANTHQFVDSSPVGNVDAWGLKTFKETVTGTSAAISSVAADGTPVNIGPGTKEAIVTFDVRATKVGARSIAISPHFGRATMAGLWHDFGLHDNSTNIGVSAAVVGGGLMEAQIYAHRFTVGETHRAPGGKLVKSVALEFRWYSVTYAYLAVGLGLSVGGVGFQGPSRTLRFVLRKRLVAEKMFVVEVLACPNSNPKSAKVFLKK